MNKLYIQKDSDEDVDVFLYFDDEAILTLDNFIVSSFGEDNLCDYYDWVLTFCKIRLVTPEMVDSVYSFASLMEWEVITIENDLTVPDEFIISCKEL
jgi:hypothetical protein